MVYTYQTETPKEMCYAHLRQELPRRLPLVPLDVGLPDEIMRMLNKLGEDKLDTFVIDVGADVDHMLGEVVGREVLQLGAVGVRLLLAVGLGGHLLFRILTLFVP